MNPIKLTADDLQVDSFTTQDTSAQVSDTARLAQITNPTAMTFCRICPEYPLPE